MDDSLDEWFAREILVHEGALVAFLHRAWPDHAEVNDLRQEAYVRVYEAAARARPTAPRPFLFTTARHLITDRLRRGRVVSIEPVGDLEALNVLIDEVSPERRLDAHQILHRLAAAFDRLPPRCREVVWLRRVGDLSQKEVAAALGVSESVVENEGVKGIRKILQTMREETGDPDYRRKVTDDRASKRQ